MGVKYIEFIGLKELNIVEVIVEVENEMDIRVDIFYVLSEVKLFILMMRVVDLMFEEIFLQFIIEEKEVEVV